jgi:hypothetical protein
MTSILTTKTWNLHTSLLLSWLPWVPNHLLFHQNLFKSKKLQLMDEDRLTICWYSKSIRLAIIPIHQNVCNYFSVITETYVKLLESNV